MIDILEKQVDENLKLIGKRRDKFLREARALRANLDLRRQQQKERKKCMSSK